MRPPPSPTPLLSCRGARADAASRIWDTLTGQCLRTLVHEDNAAVTAVRFSPNGKYVLAWTLDSCVRLWAYVEGKALKTYQGHRNQRFSLGGGFGVYGDGARCFVASGSEDGRVLLWNITSKEELQTWQAHDGVVLALDTDMKDRRIVTGGEDGLVKVWGEEEDDEDETYATPREVMEPAADADEMAE